MFDLAEHVLHQKEREIYRMFLNKKAEKMDRWLRTRKNCGGRSVKDLAINEMSSFFLSISAECRGISCRVFSLDYIVVLQVGLYGSIDYDFN
jgi:hypothetical protein